MVACLRYLSSQAQKDLTLAHLMHLYDPKIFRGGVIKLSKYIHIDIITIIKDENDRGWMEGFVVIAPGDIVSLSEYLIPQTWYYTFMFS